MYALYPVLRGCPAKVEFAVLLAASLRIFGLIARSDLLDLRAGDLPANGADVDSIFDEDGELEPSAASSASDVLPDDIVAA